MNKRITSSAKFKFNKLSKNQMSSIRGGNEGEGTTSSATTSTMTIQTEED